MGNSQNAERILAIDPTPYGFAYAVLEGPERLIDWGTAWVNAKEMNAGNLNRLRKLLEFYEPNVLVLEDPEGDGSCRCERIRRLLRGCRKLATERRVRVRGFSRAQVRSAIGVYTKEAIAWRVAARFTELAHRLPPHRKIWMSEDPRMNLFDAMSFALTYFALKSRCRGARRQELIPARAPRKVVTGPRALAAILGDEFRTELKAEDNTEKDRETQFVRHALPPAPLSLWPLAAGPEVRVTRADERPRVVA